MAAQVIDALVIELGVDNKRLRRDAAESQSILDKAKEGAKKTGEEIEGSFESAGDAILAVRDSLLEFLAVFIGTKDVAGFLDGIRKSDTSLGRLGLTLNENIGTLSTWGNAAVLAGGKAEDAYGTFQNLTSEIQQFSITGQSSAVPFFRAMGVELVDANGKARDLHDVLLDMAKWAQGQNPARAAEILRGARVTEGMIPLLLQGPDKVRAFLQATKQYAPTAEDVKNATALTVQYGLMAAAIQKLGNVAMSDWTPVMLAMSKAVQTVADVHSGVIPFAGPLSMLRLQSEGVQGPSAFGGHASALANNSVPLTASGGLPLAAQRLLGGIATAEGANYNSLYGGGTFSGYGSFPQWAGRRGPTGAMTHAAGRYQFEPGTWARAAKALSLKDFSPESQDKAALWLAQQTYHGDLLKDLASGNPAALAHIAASLGSQWAGVKDRPGAFLGQIGAGPAAVAAGAGSLPFRGVSSSSSHEANIGTINIYGVDTNNTSDVAGHIGGALDRSIGSQAQGGPQ